MKINLGCGKDYKAYYINIDHPNKLNYADIYHDLDVYPYPFKDHSAEEILLIDVLDHIQDNRKTIEECYRILKIGGRLKIQVPHWHSPLAYYDMTHTHYFAPQIFDTLFLENTVYKVTSCDNKFNLIRKHLNPSKVWGQFLPQRLLSFLSMFIGNLVDTIDIELEKAKEEMR